MGYSNLETGGCRRHPNQKQSPGVCSFCLRERLSRLSTESVDSSFKTSNSAFSDSSSLSSPPRNRAHQRNGSVDVAARLGFLLHQGTANANLIHPAADAAALKKSKSVAWAPRKKTNAGIGKGAEDDKEDKTGKKQGGLWKKLIHSSSRKKKGVLMHSMTSVNDRSQDTNSFRIS